LSEPKRPATIITKDEVAQKEDAKKIVAVEVANESSEKANQVEIVQAKQKPPIESQVEINKEKKPTLEPVITKKRKEIPKVEYSKVEVIEPIIKEVTKLVELSLAPEPPKIAEEAKKEKTVSIATTIDQIKSIQDDIELKEMLASLYSEKDIEEVKKFEKVTRSQVVQFVIRRLSENQLSIRNAMCLAASFTKRQGKAFGIFNFEKLIKELKGCDDKTIDKVIEPIKQGKNIDEIVDALYGEDEL